MIVRYEYAFHLVCTLTLFRNVVSVSLITRLANISMQPGERRW